jgi:MoaA/NifB/PqqE/SkfB family radical SAM enzyme
MANLLSKARSVNERFLPKKLFFAPEWVVLGVNNVCNLHCKMCDVGTQTTQTNFAQNLLGAKPLNMPVELARLLINQMETHAPNAKLGLGFTEPLIYPHLEELLKHSQQKKIETSITTNALKLKQRAEMVCELGVADVFISLDGLHEVHNEIRGHKRSFEAALEGIEAVLSRERRPDISVFFVITPWNMHQMYDFVKFFERYPIKHLGFMHTNFTTEAMANKHNELFANSYPATHSNIEEFNPNDLNLELIWAEIQRIKRADPSFGVSFSPEIDSFEMLQDFYQSPEKKMGKSCKDVFRNIMVKSDGTVIPAHGRCYNLTIGDLYKNSLAEIWNSKVISDFRSTLHSNGGLLPACNRCCSAF